MFLNHFCIYRIEIKYCHTIDATEMAFLGQQGGDDSDDGMDEFMEKFKTEKYKNAFNESNWEEVRISYLCAVHYPNHQCDPSESGSVTKQCLPFSLQETQVI